MSSAGTTTRSGARSATRFDTDRKFLALADVYRHAVPLMNFFLPGMRLIEKRREGARIIKRHDEATTPYMRLMSSPHVSDGAKAALKACHDGLDMVQLKLSYDEALGRLASFNKAKSAAEARIAAPAGSPPG